MPEPRSLTLPRIVQDKGLLGDLLRAAFQPLVVKESIRKQHDIGSHSVLMGEVDYRGRMCVREPLEQAHFKAIRARYRIPDLGLTGREPPKWYMGRCPCLQAYKRRQLVVITD
jgi:hypothetical protein